MGIAVGVSVTGGRLGISGVGVGTSVGESEGTIVGDTVGFGVGAVVGAFVGCAVGDGAAIVGFQLVRGGGR